MHKVFADRLPQCFLLTRAAPVTVQVWNRSKTYNYQLYEGVAVLHSIFLVLPQPGCKINIVNEFYIRKMYSNNRSSRLEYTSEKNEAEL